MSWVNYILLNRLATFLLILFLPSYLFAGNINLIRDDEIETTIRSIANPIFKAAKLDPNRIRIYIVNDESLNAFVAGGMNIFINSGLINKFDDPAVLAGVIAHETAHISSSHLIAGRSGYEEQSKTGLASILIGLGTTIAGAPDAGFAIMAGGTHAAMMNVLHYSRQHEEVADKLAIRYLDNANYKADGLLKLFEQLHLREQGVKLDPYLRTHPLTSKRVQFIRDNSKKLQNNQGIPQSLSLKFRRAALKLNAFTGSYDKLINQKSLTDSEKEYVLAIVSFKEGKVNKALQLLDELISKNPSDAYLVELKGQFLYESGKAKEAVASYEKAHTLLPHSTMIMFVLAQAKITYAEKTNNRRQYTQAISLLTQVVENEKDYIIAWYYLSVAYGKLGEIGKAHFALANKEYLLGNKKLAQKHLKIVLGKIKRNTKEYLEGEDLLLQLEKN